MKLLEPYQLGNITLGNRVVMAPMTRNRAGNEDLAATDMIADYYAQRASAGLIITEGTHVSMDAIGSLNVPDIYTEKQINGWKKVTHAVHQKDGKIFAQLWHVGRISHSSLRSGKLPLAPSSINPNYKTYGHKGFLETETPKEMSPEDIQQTILDFKQAAMNAMKADFDGVEIHAANGYLFHQFFAKCANIRKDKYGGSIENRTRFLFDVLDAMSSVIDLSKVGVRIAPTLDQTFGITLDEEMPELFEYLVKKLNNYPLAYLHISGFSLEKVDNEMDVILQTAKKYRKIYKGTLMINKGFDATSGNKAIEEGIADLISYGIPFISNPDLVERFRLGKPLSPADRKTFYGPGAKGYIDYKKWNE